MKTKLMIVFVSWTLFVFVGCDSEKKQENRQEQQTPKGQIDDALVEVDQMLDTIEGELENINKELDEILNEE